MSSAADIPGRGDDWAYVAFWAAVKSIIFDIKARMRECGANRAALSKARTQCESHYRLWWKKQAFKAGKTVQNACWEFCNTIIFSVVRGGMAGAWSDFSFYDIILSRGILANFIGNNWPPPKKASIRRGPKIIGVSTACTYEVDTQGQRMAALCRLCNGVDS